ncbi:hypothetical protein [Acinetobacter sp. MD2(2019)]|uniref:hypothetical protein n=1 Tax=Acinetobacter sp. MD2(2019) TaxID=2605273 RepID=UPI002D1E50FF|nr:hypothetical protein [Acinetobacter sp. MD2(2019)]MEB3754300.1 hypothetical protein [Acinetobacter sp. MD2(2019)]
MSLPLFTRMMTTIRPHKTSRQHGVVEVFKYNHRAMTAMETDFISSIQCMELNAVALLLVKYEQRPQALNLIKIAMQYHIYKNDFDDYLKANRKDLKVKAAYGVWKTL